MDALSTLHRQKGRAYQERRKQYRKNKSQSKRQSKLWRQKNKSKIKRYRQQVKRSPAMHRMKHAEEEQLLQNVSFWDLKQDLPGEVEAVSPEDETVQVRLEGPNNKEEEKSYDILDFLSNTVILEEADEAALYEILDGLYGDDEKSLPERVARRFLARF